MEKNPILYTCGLASGPRWIVLGDHAICSNCGGNSGTQYDGVEPIPRLTPYCPYCGKKMEN